MGLFEMLFPQWAAAEHTAEISEQLQNQQLRQNFNDDKTSLLNKQIKELQDEVASLYLINYTLIELLQSKKVLNEEELRQKMDEIDLRDGKKDGKIGQ
jgi:hypothetical protein